MAFIPKSGPKALCPRFVLMGSFLNPMGLAREQRVHLILFRWNSPPKQLAVSGGIICGSSNVSLRVTKKRGIFAGENSIADTCWSTAGLSRVEDGCNCWACHRRGSLCLSSDKTSWYTQGLPDLICSVTPTVISLLSDLLVFDSVFPGPCWGLLAGCAHGVCCSFPEALSLKWGKLFWTDSTRNSWIYWVLAFIQKPQFGNEGALAGYFQRSDLLQDTFKDDLPQHLAEPSPSGHQGLHGQALVSPICVGTFWISCALVLSFVFRCLMPVAGAEVLYESLMDLMAFYGW